MVERYSHDAMQRADDVAYDMRDFYEANRPLRWWEKRNLPGSWGCIADDLMLGLRNIVLDAERGYQAEGLRAPRQSGAPVMTDTLPEVEEVKRTSIFGEEQPQRIWLTCYRHDDVRWTSSWPEEDGEEHEAVEYARADLIDQLQRDNAALRERVARRDDQREHMLNSIVEDGRLFLDLKAWLLQCHDWLLSSDLDMQCPMQTDPLDLVDRIDRSFGVPRVLLNPSNTGGR